MTCSPASRTRLSGPGQPVHQTASSHPSISRLRTLYAQFVLLAPFSPTPLTPILLVSRETRDAFLGAGRRAEFSESFPRPPEAWHCEYDSAIEMLPKTAFLLKRRRGPGNPRRDLARPRLGSGLRQKKKMASHSSMGVREVVRWEGRGEGPHNNRATRRPTPKAKQHRVQPRHENDYLSAYRIQEHHTP